MTTPAATRRPARKFYFVMALVFVATAVIGFSQTYLMPMAAGAFKGPAIFHVHGLLFFGWLLLYAAQTGLVASGRTGLHRELGLLGIALATAMIFSVMVTVVVQIHVFDGYGTGDGMRVFSWVQVGGMAFFGTLFTLAIVHARKPEVHKRLMMLATISLMDAALARFIGLNFLPPPPPGPPAHPPVVLAVMGGLAAAAFILVAIVYDWRTRGRPHPVWLWGGAAYLALQLTRVPVSESAWWMNVATAIGNLGG